jgi:hypothetical protein
MIQFCDKYAGVYSQYIFTIPLIGYVRVDPLPDIMDPVVRKKYGLKEITDSQSRTEHSLDEGSP